MKIIDLIKAACKTKGVDVKHASRIQKSLKISKAEEVETAIDSFKENILPVIEEAEAKAKTAAEKATKKTAGEEALIAFREKHGLDEDGKPIKKDPDPDPSKISPEVKAIMDAQSKAIEDLTKLVKTNASSVSTAEKTATATKLVADAKLPEGWVSRVDLNSETPMEEQIEALTEEYTEIQQGAITDKVKSGEFTPGFQTPKERSEKEWTELMNEDEETSDPGAVDLGIY